MRYLIFGSLESTIDIIIWFPNPRNAILVVPKPLLEMSTQFAQNDSIRRLLVDLGA